MRFMSSGFYDLPGNFYANTKPALTDRAREIRHTPSLNVKTELDSGLWRVSFIQISLLWWQSESFWCCWRSLNRSQDLRILLRHGKGRERNNDKRCIQTSEIWGNTQTIEFSAACILAGTVHMHSYLAILSLFPSLSELYLLFQRFAITIISITSSCQPGPKRRNATNEERKKFIDHQHLLTRDSPLAF